MEIVAMMDAAKNPSSKLPKESGVSAKKLIEPAT
jgi:hypothetical protein